VNASSRATLAFAIADSLTALASAIASFKKVSVHFPKFFVGKLRLLRNVIGGYLIINIDVI
tara:strand:+ start:1584 stop:1766 length:183 start_codon:yes stop_codon:yes gene_type:complete